MSAQDPQVTRRYPTESEHPPREGFVPGELPHVKPARGAIGPYQLLCELGAGGMGTVFVAQRQLPGGVKSTVALKTLKQQPVPRPNLAEMFLDEVRIIARISHPYVCAVRDLGMANGVPYVAMDYLIGEPLSRVMPVLPQPPDITSVSCILRLVADLCEGLHAAHELRDERGTLIQVVHRDISPDNLFVLYDGTVRVVDFGVASTAELQQKGKAQTLAGKCAYMSPEQLRVKPLDRRSDVWSVGVVLYELLTGKRLFQRQSELRTAVDVLGLPIDPPSKINPLLPPAVDQLVMRILEREPEARVESARALSRELETIISNWFGLVPASRVGSWLQTMFPGSQEFRRRIVTHAEVTREPEDGHSGPHVRTRELEDNVRRAVEGQRARAIRDSLEPSDEDIITSPQLDDSPLDSLRNLEPPMQVIQVPHNDNVNDPNAKSLISAWLDEQSTPKFEAAPIEAIGLKKLIGIPTVSEPVELPRADNRQRTLILAGSLLAGLTLVIWWAQRDAETKSARPAVVVAPVREEPSAELMRAPTFEPPPAEEPTLRPDEPVQPAPVVEPALPTAVETAEPAASAEAKPVVTAKPVRMPVAPRGNVYVIARDPTFRVLQRGKLIKVPAMIALSPGAQVIEFTREGSGKLSTLPVEIKAGTTSLLSLD